MRGLKALHRPVTTWKRVGGGAVLPGVPSSIGFGACCMALGVSQRNDLQEVAYTLE